MQLTEEEIQIQLDRRRPGQAGAGAISTGRNEADAVQILSGPRRRALPPPPRVFCAARLLSARRDSCGRGRGRAACWME